MTKLGETLYNLHWLACGAEGYVGDRAAAEALLAALPAAPSAITGAALDALTEVFADHVDVEVEVIANLSVAKTNRVSS